MDNAIDWQVESLRVTVFPVDNSQIELPELWNHRIGVEPDEIQIKRGRFNARHAEYQNGVIFLIKQQEKIDWRYRAKPEQNPGEFNLLIVGSLNQELEPLLKFSKNWLGAHEMFAVKRMAFGAVLLAPALNLEKVFNDLDFVFPGMNLQNVQDFGYQINRKRQSEVVNGLDINRLAQWGVVRPLRIDPDLDTLVNDNGDASKSGFASRLELDINTVPDSSNSLPAEKLTDIFQELVDMGLEIAAKGDIP